MKLNKLLPIVALTGIATVATPLVSCGDNGGDTPVEKTIILKTKDNKNLPGAIKVGGPSVVIAAFDEEGSPIDGVTFATTSTTIKLNGSEVIAQNPGPASITCTAPGYTETKWDFIVTTEIGPWDQFSQFSGGSGVISDGKYDMKNGKTYSATYHIDSETTASMIMFFVVNNPETELPPVGAYDFVAKENCSLEIDGGESIHFDIQQVEGVSLIFANIDDTIKGQDLVFTVTCVSDYDNAYLLISMPS